MKCASNIVCDSLNFPSDRRALGPNCKELNEKGVNIDTKQICLYKSDAITNIKLIVKLILRINFYNYHIGMGNRRSGGNCKEGEKGRQFEFRAKNNVARYNVWRNYKTLMGCHTSSNMLFYRTRN